MCRCSSWRCCRHPGMRGRARHGAVDRGAMAKADPVSSWQRCQVSSAQIYSCVCSMLRKDLMHSTQCIKKYKKASNLLSSHVYRFRHYDGNKAPGRFRLNCLAPSFVPSFANNDMLQLNSPPSALITRHGVVHSLKLWSHLQLGVAC
jgi:hypothetical protein